MADKKSRSYRFVKYKIYKPIRNFLCHYGYGEHVCDKDLIERRKRFIDGVKNEY